MACLLDHLRSQILRRTAYRKLLVTAFNIALGKAEIGQFDVSISSNQHILRFEAGLEENYSRYTMFLEWRYSRARRSCAP